MGPPTSPFLDPWGGVQVNCTTNGDCMQTGKLYRVCRDVIFDAADGKGCACDPIQGRFGVDCTEESTGILVSLGFCMILMIFNLRTMYRIAKTFYMKRSKRFLLSFAGASLFFSALASLSIFVVQLNSIIAAASQTEGLSLAVFSLSIEIFIPFMGLFTSTANSVVGVALLQVLEHSRFSKKLFSMNVAKGYFGLITFICFIGVVVALVQRQYTLGSGVSAVNFLFVGIALVFISWKLHKVMDTESSSVPDGSRPKSSSGQVSLVVRFLRRLSFSSFVALVCLVIVAVLNSLPITPESSFHPASLSVFFLQLGFVVPSGSVVSYLHGEASRAATRRTKGAVGDGYTNDTITSFQTHGEGTKVGSGAQPNISYASTGSHQIKK